MSLEVPQIVKELREEEKSRLFYKNIDDIKDKKTIDINDQESQNLYKNLFETIPDGIITVNKLGIVTSCNPAFLELTGYTEPEIVGKHITRVPTISLKLLQKPMKLFDLFLKGELPKEFVFKWRHKDGSIRLGEARTKSIIREGKKEGLLAVVRDITDLRKFEENLIASEEKYRMIFNNVTDNICYLDKKGIILDLNPRIYDLSGYTPEELIGKNFADVGFFKGENLINKFKIFKKVIFEKKPFYFENIEILHKNGSVVFVDVNIKPIMMERKIKGILAFARDVTFQKKAEEESKESRILLQKMNDELEEKVKERTIEIENLLRQKDEFINQLGHDLKNPLNPLVNLLPIIEQKERDPEKKEMLKIINRNIGYMKNLTVKTIQLAQLNSKTVMIDLKEIKLLPLIEEVINTNKFLFKGRKIEVINNVPSDIWILADKLRIEEVFFNLLSNSVKYSDISGKITIDANRDKNFVIISISDTGIGMDTEQLTNVFSEFYKADLSRHDFDSSGLGMPISKRIVELHGGQIWAESEGIGKGSKFIFTLKTKSELKNKSHTEYSKRINIINHKGKEIVYMDYSNLKEGEYTINEIIEFITNYGKYDLLILTDVSGNFFNLEDVKSTRNAGKILKPYIKKNAIIGISKKQEIFLKAVKLFSDFELKAFDSIESAKDWLVE